MLLNKKNNLKLIFFYMNIVYFKEKDHKYHSKSQEYISVSGLWKPYFKPFDSESIALKKAFKDLDPENYNRCKSVLFYDHPDFINMLMDNTDLPIDEIKTEAYRLQQSWIATSETGTAFHTLQENNDHARGFRINTFDGKPYPIVRWDIKEGYENQSFPGKLIDIPDGYIAEHLVKNDEHLVAGQLDQNFIETINGVRYIDIDDWKSDRVILLKPEFFNRKTGGFQKMIYPMDHIYETNYWKYAMKISTYANILEKEGFVVRNLGFTHVDINENLEIIKETKYKIPYKKFEVEIALAERKKSL